MKTILILFITSLGFYFVAILFYIFELMTRHAALRKAAAAAAICGFLLQTSFLISISLFYRHLPFSNVYEVTAFLSWAIMVLYYFSRIKFETRFLNLPVIFIVSILYLT